jgi:hypothetical protein
MQVVKCLGGENVMKIMQDLRIPTSSIIFKLTARMSNLSIPVDEAVNIGVSTCEIYVTSMHLHM